MKKSILAAVAMVGCLATMAMADVTGDFKVTGYGYTNDVATVSGTVNHGAIQSKKTVVVDVTYEYSFAAEKTETIPGETTTVIVFVPGKCVTGVPNTEGCFDKNGDPKATNGAIWTGTYETSTTTTEPTTVTQTFNGTQGMTAITEPTIEKGRLNPKGKITGYSWTNTLSIVPNADLVDPDLVPYGYSVVSVTINSVSYSAYLKDAAGSPITDTVTTGTMPIN
ncbi:MAG: hypothetical protein CVU69_03135 [Deltaproteobacteria bacterium HGW-Deltaproteobacteria-4]|nr:MAG: hypothetical protein CVU69_03135 [Deltaproteobacteria bacterium HGW-Deltaproteobacteria-4]